MFMDIAIASAVSSKNVHGYSPNQLVFGFNPNFPSVLTSKLPAMESKTSSEIVLEHLTALHCARKAFVQSEANERLNRVIKKQTRSSTSLVFQNGDLVYYKKDGSHEWKGPGKVIGTDSQTVLIKHGSIHVRVHPCRIRHQNYEFSKSESDKSSRLCQIDDFSTETSSAYKENSYMPLEFESDDETGPGEREIPHNIQALGSSSQEGLQEFQDVSLDVHLPSTQEDAHESLNESTGETGSSSESQGKSVVKFSPIVLPCMKSTVQYLSNKDDKWKTVDVISRSGKATGKYRNFLNIKDKETDQIKCIDWKEEVKEWIPVNTEQVLMTGTKLQDLSVAEAKLKELQKWKNYEVYEEIPNEGQRIISCRWVCTEKPTVNGTVIKARLIARGFEEESYVLHKDSPTCSKESLRLIFTIISSNHWEVNSLDIQSAFLQGKSITRDVYLMPPKEAGTEMLWKLKKCVYGLTDASRHWYLRVAEELSKLGVHKSIYDDAVFYWYFGKYNVLHGIICTHMDDFFWGGSARFKSSVIDRLKEVFQISQKSHYNFIYVGLQVSQHQDGIKMHQCADISEMKVMEIDKERLHESLNADEKQKYRTLIGQLN